MNGKIERLEGVITSLDQTFGNGGIGYLKDITNKSYFFHARYVDKGGYRMLNVGDKVTFYPIRAKSAMGAGPQARQIKKI
ncbi:TPA: cold-shock protein [Vibrio parahaemolyticus]|uniref:cold-shock protein n=1 Tax=Vibrio parahaemolyticus TaxID=670 RepID=UPI0015940F4D|nr:cold shock domain-containing protein [Vibrio parahaemolyticus]MDF4641967.1 cold shock domain-containing protein [Vibrio parahaemolyticus]